MIFQIEVSLYKKLVLNFLANYSRITIGYCSDNNRKQKKKVFREGGGFVNIKDPEGRPTVTSTIPEGDTTEKKVAVSSRPTSPL